MNREIKFRAWDLDNQIMYYSDRDESDGEDHIEWVFIGNIYEEAILPEKKIP